MTTMTIVESVRSWLQTCPALEDGVLNIDWLPPDAREYSVDVVPCTELLRRYTAGGTSKKQFQFNLSSRTFVGEDIRDAQDNHEFYEAFSAWVERCNAAGALPELGEKRAAQRVTINTSGYPMTVSEDGRARYQIQMTLRYLQEE